MSKLRLDTLLKPDTPEEKRIQKKLRIAVKLASLFEGREWQLYPNEAQSKFQAKMLARAEAVLKIAEEN